MTEQPVRSKERALFYLESARAFLDLHDKGQNLFIEGKITLEFFIRRSDFYRHEIERYQELAQRFDPSATLSELY